jgi:cytochrome P450
VGNGFQKTQVQPHVCLIVTNFFKTTVYVTGYAVFHSPANFRNPEDFIPERWISSEYDSDNKSALQPFSIGPRNCVGKK